MILDYCQAKNQVLFQRYDYETGCCRSVITSPTIIDFRRATSGLDPIMRDDMLDVFLEFVQDENHSILLSSHITSDLEKIADYITFIHNGKLIMAASKMIWYIILLLCAVKKANFLN